MSNRLARWWRRWKARLRRALAQDTFLCDSCKWNWRSACRRRERPNAMECPDYEERGRS